MTLHSARMVPHKQSSVSRNFLHEIVTPNTVDIDVVAVHGLNPRNKRNHAFETWTAANKAMWLRDEGFLRTALPQARVLLFGYNSNVAFKSSTAGVREQAENLLNLLEGARTGANNRPIIFLCHSLGGLVVKRALVHAKLDSTYHPIISATCGVAFFGCPHRGGNHIKLGHIAASVTRFTLRNPHNTFMEALKDSLLAETLRDDFRQQLMDYKFTSFFETLSFGKIGLVVEKHSATLGLPGVYERQIGLQSDHRNLCKFLSPNDDNYKQVIHNIKWLAEDDRQARRKLLSSSSLDVPTDLTPNAMSTKNALLIIPYPRNRDFVSRGDHLQRLDSEFSNYPGYHVRLAVCGIGGVGKSQLAIEFAYLLHRKNNHISIFWVNGSNATVFEESYREIARRASILCQEDKITKVLPTVLNWLEGTECGKWLIIVDNADDGEVFSCLRTLDTWPSKGSEDNKYRLADFIPMSSHGSVLITTRDKATGMKLAGVGHVIEMERMNLDAAKALALKKISLTTQPDDVSMKILVEDCMECLPLAIVQAAAFIGCTGMTVASYVRLYQASECSAMELLSEEFEDLGRDLSRPSAIIRTLAISFNQIKRQDRRAAELLFLMAHLNRQGIPKSLLRDDHELELSLEKSIGILKAFAFVTESSDDEDLNMHHLVHLAVRKFLRDAGEADEWAVTTLRNVSKMYPDGGVSTWKTCAKYLSHAQAALSSPVNNNGSNLDRAQLLHKTGVYLEEQGRYDTAAKMVQEASGLREHILGKDDPLTLRSKHKYGWVLLRQGRYDEAEEICRQELEGRHLTAGNDHSETLQSMNLLADVLRRKCNYAEAEKLYRKILPLTVRVNGKEHHFTLACKFNFAVVLEVQGCFKEAEKWIRDVVTEREKIFGREHPTVFDSISRVGCILNRQGRYAEAERLHRDLLCARKQALGEQHPDILISMRNLGIALREQGNQEEAQKLFRHVLEGREKALGEFHPYTLGISYNLARSLFLQGRHSSAAQVLTQVCERQELTLGFLHQDTLASTHLLAKVFEGDDQGSRAEELYRRVIVGSEKVFGREHLDTVQALCDLAFLVSKQHEFQPAMDLAERLTKRDDVLEESIEMRQKVVNLARALDQTGQFETADVLYRLGIAAIDRSSDQGEYGAEFVKKDYEDMLQKVERTQIASQASSQSTET